jgi:hypothetical protein
VSLFLLYVFYCLSVCVSHFHYTSFYHLSKLCRFLIFHLSVFFLISGSFSFSFVCCLRGSMSVCLSVSLFLVHLSVYLPFSIALSFSFCYLSSLYFLDSFLYFVCCLRGSMSYCLPACLSVCLSVCLCLSFLFIFRSLYHLSIFRTLSYLLFDVFVTLRLSVSLSVCLSVSLSLCVSVRLSVCLSLCL